MKTVGIFEARRNLSALLERVRRGEEIVITRHGRAVARLVPLGTARRDRLEETAARLKAFRRGRRLGGLSAKALLEEGRCASRRQAAILANRKPDFQFAGMRASSPSRRGRRSARSCA